MTTPAGGTVKVPARLVRVIGITRRPRDHKDRPQPVFHIRPARISDLSAIIGLIDEAAG